jgi:hypothetical protein
MVLRTLIVVALAGALCTAGASARTGGGTPGAFVTVTGASLVVGVDLTAGRVVARIRVPKGPREIVRVPSPLEQLLVTSPRAGTVTLVDARRERVVKIWRGFIRPRDVVSTGRWAYVTDEARSQLVVLDLEARRIVARVAIRPAPQNVAVGDTALLTHGGGSTRLTIAELSSTIPPRVLRFRHMEVGGAAEDISRAGDTAYAYVTYLGSGVVGALDWGQGRMLWRRSIGSDVRHIAVDYYHGRRLWATDHGAGDVLLLSSPNGRVLRRLHGCRGAEGLAFVGTAWIAAACNNAGVLAFWSQRTWQRHLVRVGDGPYAVAEVVLP